VPPSRGTPDGDNPALCAGYLGDSAKDTWINYHPALALLSAVVMMGAPFCGSWMKPTGELPSS